MASPSVDEVTKKLGSLKVYDSHEKYKELKTKMIDGNLRGGNMEEISVFYHVTTAEKKAEILKSRMLKANECKSQKLGPCGPIVGNTGVFFCCSLTKNGAGQIALPEDSPYGTERVQIPVERFFGGTGGWRLSFDSYRWCSGHCYVYLVLDREYNVGITRFCKENLYQIDLQNDVIFRRTWSGNYEAYHKIVNKNIFWVEIFVLGDIVLTGNEQWDTVRWTKEQ